MYVCYISLLLKGDTALRVAAATGNVEVTDLLIRNKADVNAIGYNVSNFCSTI